MYNPTTHVQVPIDTDLSSYYFKKKIRWRDSPTVFLLKKMEAINYKLPKCWTLEDGWCNVIFNVCCNEFLQYCKHV
jgi:hypothetical protein